MPNIPRQRDTEKEYKPNDHKALTACSLHNYVFNIAVILARFLFWYRCKAIPPRSAINA